VGWPVTAMVARSAPAIPVGERWSYEPKLDGFRCIALLGPHGQVRLQSRQHRPLTPAFPDVAHALATALPAGTVLDGELVVMNGGRVDFPALQRRLATRRPEPDAPAALVAFDLLATDTDPDLRALPQQQRRARLEQLLDHPRPGLALMPTTRELLGAHAWLGLDYPGVEGVVAKRVDQGYYPRRRHWSKIRATTTVEAIVGGVIGPRTAPTALVLGRHDTRGRLRVIGRTLPLGARARAELAALLTEPHRPHPWPTTLPASRLGLPHSPPVSHTPVAPTMVVEVETDTTSHTNAVLRHGARYLRTRTELHAPDLSPWPDYR
jgi:ATP-dependent DNA ligase